jgi:hypothetical protein
MIFDRVDQNPIGDGGACDGGWELRWEVIEGLSCGQREGDLTSPESREQGESA